ncbi:hypothetical protein SSS_01549 [Sarcoptes scabiei]|uniref:Uncharacterized protein n=1 Tax=Sarcoptes scabiei TaxID=52283 RepID=A0A834REZ3_SARSC|nr:hypothetical protein SSS_01549 [Sarcoptes scabiei]
MNHNNDNSSDDELINLPGKSNLIKSKTFDSKSNKTFDVKQNRKHIINDTKTIELLQNFKSNRLQSIKSFSEKSSTNDLLLNDDEILFDLMANMISKFEKIILNNLFDSNNDTVHQELPTVKRNTILPVNDDENDDADDEEENNDSDDDDDDDDNDEARDIFSEFFRLLSDNLVETLSGSDINQNDDDDDDDSDEINQNQDRRDQALNISKRMIRRRLHALQPIDLPESSQVQCDRLAKAIHQSGQRIAEQLRLNFEKRSDLHRQHQQRF